MRPLTTTMALGAVVLVLGAPSAAHAASNSSDESRHYGEVRLCVREGAGAISLEGEHVSRATPALSDGCTPPLWVPTGMYKATISKYLSAPCYRTVNGGVVNPPQRVTNGARCPGVVHDVEVDHWRRGAHTQLRGDQVDFRVGRYRTTTVTFHVTDVRYPDCIGGAGAPEATEHVCSPTGPTT